MPSEAHRALKDRLRDVDQLMKAHEAVGGPEAGRRNYVEGLNRAAVLMLCAHFEGYVEDGKPSKYPSVGYWYGRPGG